MVTKEQRPIDIATRETAAFVRANLSAPATLLEVGCGQGHLAAFLSADGYSVTGIDPQIEAAIKARNQQVQAVVASWPAFAISPRDAILFTRSLHHIPDLDGAIRAARAALHEDGLLLVEDFAFHSADRATVEWLANILRDGRRTGLVREVDGELATAVLESADPLGVWHESHDDALHSSGAMTEAIKNEFEVEQLLEVPYLYRYVIPVLPETPAALFWLMRVLAEELRAGAAARLVLIGRRIVARSRTAA